MRLALLSIVLLGLMVGLIACNPASVEPTLLPGERPTATPLPPAPAWREPSTAINLSNITQLTQLGRIEAPSSTPSTIFAFALSPNSTRLAALNNTDVISWDLITGQGVFFTERREETTIYYSPDKDEIYTIGGPPALINILNTEDGTYETTLIAHPDYNGITAYHADTGLIALAGVNGEIKVWDMFERVSRATLIGQANTLITDLEFSSDGATLAVIYADASIQLWDWATRTLSLTLEAIVPEQRVVLDQARFSPDGDYIAVSAFPYVVVWELTTGRLRYFLEIMDGGADAVFFFIPNTSYLITIGSAKDGAIWDLRTGQIAAVLPDIGGDDVDASLSPDGTMLFTSTYETGVNLWNLSNLANGTITRSAQEFGNPNILNLHWTGDGLVVLMFDARGPIEIWGIPAA
ncbi:MAG: hypothetical protein MUF87_12460 [Anaerolineae bacterium]|jgi:WD40 repeat protein|nr:hypothetical protein [Anaerolineae bacterium]